MKGQRSKNVKKNDKNLPRIPPGGLTPQSETLIVLLTISVAPFGIFLTAHGNYRNGLHNSSLHEKSGDQH
jgi:hypothetical protein